VLTTACCPRTKSTNRCLAGVGLEGRLFPGTVAAVPYELWVDAEHTCDNGMVGWEMSGSGGGFFSCFLLLGWRREVIIVRVL